jgi:hypothetical protein
MPLDEDVRAALRPLDDQGLVHLVEVDVSLAAHVGAPPNPLATTAVTIVLNTLDPEAHREQIEHLVHANGIRNVELVLKTHPPSDQPATTP